MKSKIIDNLIEDNKRLSKKVILLEEEIEHIHIRVYDIEVAALAIWEKMPQQNIADVNEVGVCKTQILIGNLFETFLLFTVYSKSIYVAKYYS